MAARVRKYAGLRHLIVLLTACCLFLSGCGAKLSDSGTIPSVTIAKDTPFTLEVSTEEVQKRGMRVDGLTAAIQEQLQTAGGVEAANGPGPGTLAVCFDDHGSHGCCPDGGRRAGDCGGGRPRPDELRLLLHRPERHCGGVLGAATGATLGHVMSEGSREAREIWACGPV